MMTTTSPRGQAELEVGARLEASLPGNYRGDAVLPVQFYDIVGRSRWQDGEYRLAFAVLADAVASYYKYRGARGRKGRMLFEEVKLWMQSRNRNGIFAYRVLCEVLGIDPDALMSALEKQRNPPEPALREIRVWRGKPQRGLSVASGGGRRSVRPTRAEPVQSASM
jgi:hypothetical protein